jgi:hypothetical protein
MQTVQLSVILSGCKTNYIAAQCLVYLIRSEIQTPCILFAQGICVSCVTVTTNSDY